MSEYRYTIHLTNGETINALVFHQYPEPIVQATPRCEDPFSFGFSEDSPADDDVNPYWASNPWLEVFTDCGPAFAIPMTSVLYIKAVGH